MTAMLLTTAFLVLAGVPLALALPARTRTIHGLVGESFLLGTGAGTLVLLALSSAGIAWSRLSFGIALALVALVAAPFAARQRTTWTPVRRPTLANAPDLLTLALAGGHAMLATLAPPIENDYLLIWGVKARRFLAAGGIDWAFLEAPLNVTAHPHYPVLVPLAYDIYGIAAGTWPEEWTGLFTFACGTAALLALRERLAEFMPRFLRAVSTLILMPLVFSPYIGIAEGPLIAYATIGVLSVHSGIRNDSRTAIARGAVFLGLAATCKSEGVALVAVVAMAMIAAGAWRRLPLLVPAVAIPLPWLLLHRLHGIGVDFAAAGKMDRLAERIPETGAIVRLLLGRSGMGPLFWAGIAVAVLLAFRRIALQERFLVVTAALQVLVFAAVYFVTPYDLTWHIETSWDRILRQLLPLIALTAMLPTAPVIASLLRRNNATDSRTDRPPGSAGAA